MNLKMVRKVQSLYNVCHFGPLQTSFAVTEICLFGLINIHRLLLQFPPQYSYEINMYYCYRQVDPHCLPASIMLEVISPHTPQC